MHGSRKLWLMAVVTFLLATNLIAQSVPTMINYQGRLFDGGGSPVNDPALPMDFSLWDSDVTLMPVIDEWVFMGGTAAQPLVHQEVDPGSEFVTGIGGVPVYSSPADYIMDYPAGTITRVDGGGIPDGQTIEIDYDYTYYGGQKWFETQLVEVVNGLYDVRLGEVNPITLVALFGSTMYLEVVVDGDTLQPRQRLTTVPYAIRAEDASSFRGLAPTDFAMDPHSHNFSDLSGTATDAQVPDNITIDMASDTQLLDGLDGSDYVLVAGDTVTGDLQVDGYLSVGQNLNVGVDATILGGNIGLGRDPVDIIGILNDAATAPVFGAHFFGTNLGVWGSLAGDPDDHYGYLGEAFSGVRGRSGNSDETGSRYGGQFSAYTQGNAYGVHSMGFSFGTDNAYGVWGLGENSSSGPAIGGYFETSSLGTGDHYGIVGEAYTDTVSTADSIGVRGYAQVDNPGGAAYGGKFETGAGTTGDNYGLHASSLEIAGRFVNNDDPEDKYVDLATDDRAVEIYYGDSSTSDLLIGLFSYITGNSQIDGANISIDSYASNSTITGQNISLSMRNNNGMALGVDSYVLGGSGDGPQYGVRSRTIGSGPENTIGVEGTGRNSGPGDAYGGYFKTEPAGSGFHYGVRAKSDHYPVYAEHSDDPVDHYTYLSSWNRGVSVIAGASDEDHTNYGAFLIAKARAGQTYGVIGEARGYAAPPAYGVYGLADTSNGTGTAYAGYFRGYGTGAYGIYVADGIKNWVNPDPEDPEKSVAYVTVESGENVTYYSGVGTLVNGRAVISLPDHFRKVTSPDHTVTVQLTPRSIDTYGLAVIRSTNSEIEVAELKGGTGNFDFDYTVKGLRLGYEQYEPVIYNVDYVPFQGNLASMDESEVTTQEWYDKHPEGVKKIFKQNGTLDENGKVNDQVFKDKGWKLVKVKKEQSEYLP